MKSILQVVSTTPEHTQSSWDHHGAGGCEVVAERAVRRFVDSLGNDKPSFLKKSSLLCKWQSKSHPEQPLLPIALAFASIDDLSINSLNIYLGRFHSVHGRVCIVKILQEVVYSGGVDEETSEQVLGQRKRQIYT